MTNNIHTLLFRGGVILALLLLVIGLNSPMMTLSQLYFFESSFSVLAGVGQLFTEGQWLLAVIIAVFSILIPLLKLAMLFLVSCYGAELSERQQRYLKLMHDYGRWAMLDVLVVAVLIVAVKLGALVSVEIHWGLYVFAAAVVLIMLLTQQAEKIANEKV